MLPKRGGSAFQHSCSPWIVLSLIHAVPILPAFLPRLRDTRKEPEGRHRASSCLVQTEKGPGVLGKPERAVGRGFQPQSLPDQPGVNVLASFPHCSERSLAVSLP